MGPQTEPVWQPVELDAHLGTSQYVRQNTLQLPVFCSHPDLSVKPRYASCLPPRKATGFQLDITQTQNDHVLHTDESAPLVLRMHAETASPRLRRLSGTKSSRAIEIAGSCCDAGAK